MLIGTKKKGFFLSFLDNWARRARCGRRNSDGIVIDESSTREVFVGKVVDPLVHVLNLVGLEILEGIEGLVDGRQYVEIKGLLCHAARCIPSRKVSIDTIRSIETSSGGNVEHDPVYCQQYPAPVLSVKGRKGARSVRFVKNGGWMSFGHP